MKKDLHNDYLHSYHLRFESKMEMGSADDKPSFDKAEGSSNSKLRLGESLAQSERCYGATQSSNHLFADLNHLHKRCQKET
jgi:hypothetical protein